MKPVGSEGSSGFCWPGVLGALRWDRGSFFKMDLVLAGPIMSGLVLGLQGKVYLEYI